MVEMISALPSFGENTGRIVGLQLGPDPGTSGSDIYGVNSLDLNDKMVIVREERFSRVPTANLAGALVISRNPNRLELLFPFLTLPNVYRIGKNPVLYISSTVADRLLQTAGTNLADFDRAEAELEPGKVSLTNVGAAVHASTKANQDLKETCYSIIGHIPGTGAEMGSGRGKGLDSQVIMVSAYYDGPGTSIDGAFHPGANDNASGVAEMLEMARVAKQGAYQPDKTLVFAAWCCGERLQGFSVWNTMQAKRGFGTMQVEAVLELSGVGAGNGNEISLGSGTSYKLVQLYQQAAGQFGIGTTTRGRSPHFGLPFIPGFGGRSALSAYVSWDGSDNNANTTRDTIDTLDPAILQKTGQTNQLVLTVLSRETQY
jgi:hypothetical protein